MKGCDSRAAHLSANCLLGAPAASSSWVQQATRRKTAREPSTRRAPQKRRSEVRTMSHKVIFWGQGTTRAPWRREAKNGQRSSCSPAATRRVNSGGWPAGDLDALRNEDRELLFDRAPAHFGSSIDDDYEQPSKRRIAPDVLDSDGEGVDCATAGATSW